MRMQNTTRAGFTLIEVMVVMALTMFIMVILAQAFASSLDTFANLKAIGDMQEKLRSATIILRDDLQNDHFEGKLRLSELNATRRPEAGFFAIKQSTPPLFAAGAPYFVEGQDTNGMLSYRATNHVLYMTVKRRGNRPQSFFSASLFGGPVTLNPFFSKASAYDITAADMPDATLAPAYAGGPTGFYNSQWAEVVYYLKRSGSTEEPNLPTSGLGTPTFNLYRAQFVMVPDGTQLRTPVGTPNTNPFVNQPQPNQIPLLNWEQTCFQQMSTAVINTGAVGPAAQWQLKFNSPAEAAIISPVVAGVIQPNRIIPHLSQFDPQPPVGTPVSSVTNRVFLNETLVTPNVISFQVQAMPTNSLVFGDIPANVNGIYDTALTATSTLGLKAVQVTIRVWDPKSRQTRQVTVVQDM
jgi:prepilin-type N-terminal cleavage/methylation domain-containing protein